MPFQLAAVEINSKDRCDVEVIEGLRVFPLPYFLRPRKAITCTDINQVGIRIVSHTVPERPATAVFPPFPGPCLGRGFHGFVLERFRGIPRYRIKPPEFLA